MSALVLVSVLRVSVTSVVWVEARFVSSSYYYISLKLYLGDGPLLMSCTYVSYHVVPSMARQLPLMDMCPPHTCPAVGSPTVIPLPVYTLYAMDTCTLIVQIIRFC